MEFLEAQPRRLAEDLDQLTDTALDVIGRVEVHAIDLRLYRRGGSGVLWGLRLED